MQAYFDAQATQIQRWFRGFWSRKYIHNYSQRKAYLAAVAEANAQTRVLAEEAYSASIRYSSVPLGAIQDGCPIQPCHWHLIPTSPAAFPAIRHCERVLAFCEFLVFMCWRSKKVSLSS